MNVARILHGLLTALCTVVGYWSAANFNYINALSSSSVSSFVLSTVLPTESRWNGWNETAPFGWTDLVDPDRMKHPEPFRHLDSVNVSAEKPQIEGRYNLHSFPGPKYLKYVTLEEATPEWREREAKRSIWDIRYPWSIFHKPDPIKAKKNTGYIMVAVTSCCKSWNMTRALLQSLFEMDDPIHVVLFDDNSKDGAQEYAAAMGIPVFTTGRMTGVTASMNRAWKYFTSYPQLQSLFILNNDIEVIPGTFMKLHRCLMSSNVPVVVGPVSDKDGLEIVYQVITSEYSVTHYYNGLKPPKEVRGDSFALNGWLEEHTQHAVSFGKMYEVPGIFGFFMGFRKDHPIYSNNQNVLMRASMNFHQELFLFGVWRVPSGVCTDVYVYHNKAATLRSDKDGHRAAKLKS